nr:putative peptide chain release factor 1, mitochondrial [Quercus suber]
MEFRALGCKQSNPHATKASSYDMSGRPWICTRCLRRALRPAQVRRPPGSRFQSTTGITPALLERARTLANEHAALHKKIIDDYDAAAAKRIGQLSATTSAVQEYDKAQSALEELQVLLQSSDREMRELAEDDVEPTKAQLALASSALKTSLVPVHPFAHLPCLIEIRPGAGGDEAGLFTGDLLNMYESYCAHNGLRTNRIKFETADGMTASTGAGGTHVQEVVLEVDSPGAYGTLRCEAGVHRVQRVPATETKGRTHTSAASVLVLPSLPSNTGSDANGDESFNDPSSDYYVDAKDVKTDVMRASGAGGQHVNKTESAVRLTHGPTGTVVAVQETRSQVQNREKAWQILRSRIAQMRREEREEEIVKLRRGAGAGKVGRENKVRTYNWSQQRVSDHRSGFDLRNLDEVMAGKKSLEQVMESVRAWMAEQEVLGVIAEEEAKQKQDR